MITPIHHTPLLRTINRNPIAGPPIGNARAPRLLQSISSKSRRSVMMMALMLIYGRIGTRTLKTRPRSRMMTRMRKRSEEEDVEEEDGDAEGMCFVVRSFISLFARFIICSLAQQPPTFLLFLYPSTISGFPCRCELELLLTKTKFE